MLHLIREDLMGQDYTCPLSGEVEADSAYIGSQIHEGERRRLRATGDWNHGPATKERAIVFAAVERRGKLRASVVGTSRAQQRATAAIRSDLHEFVLPGSLVFTDDWGGYNAMEKAGRYTLGASATRSASRSRARRTRIPSRASSATSRPTCAVCTTRSRRTGFAVT